MHMCVVCSYRTCQRQYEGTPLWICKLLMILKHRSRTPFFEVQNSISLRKLNGIRKVKTKADLPRVISSRMAWNSHPYHCTHFQVQEEKIIVKKTTQSQKLTGEDLSSGYKNTASPYPRDSHLTRNVTLAIPALSIALAFILLALIDKIDGSWNLFALFLTRKRLVCTEECGKWYWLNDMALSLPKLQQYVIFFGMFQVILHSTWS